MVRKIESELRNSAGPDVNESVASCSPEQRASENPSAGDRTPVAVLLAEIDALTARANTGDQEAVDELRKWVSNGGQKVWDVLGDLSTTVAQFLIGNACLHRPAAAKSAMQTFERQRRELAEVYSSPLERMMVDRVVLAKQFADSIDMTLAAEGTDAIARETLVRAQVAAEKRIQASLKSLQSASELHRASQVVPIGAVRQPTPPATSQAVAS